ncbi:FxsA family membrane protein [Streptomyces sp. AK02-01A]|uniref:FxsA family membrane protein n=1 Tax=Streptomyces sp. AK02-01A TaxID=3028648 RepID=UPI0029B6C603|nr:FxsA family membrane protein [Streptomyces sp. AK02-01A]MDX3855148.1 FxsA family protein [Streptomyces sp. AK02-01A]
MTTAQPAGTAPKRSRARTLIPLGIAVWLVLEIWLLTVVGDVAGGLAVLLLLVGGVVLGAVVMKSAGRRAFRNLTETLQRQQRQQREHPGEVLGPDTGSGSGGNGFLMLGGLLIMLPGLITDVLGLVLLVPPVRSVLSRYAERSLERRMSAVAAPGSFGEAFQQARMHQPDGKVVQGEVIKQDERPRREDREDKGPRPPLTS